MQFIDPPSPDRLARRRDGGATSLDRTEQLVPVDDLLTAAFIRHHSRFGCMGSLVAASGLDPDQLAHLDAQSRPGWDDFIRLSTTFPDWNSMLAQARSEWVMRRIFLFVQD